MDQSAPTQPFANFGPSLSFADSVKSATALRRGIANVPTPAQYANMLRVYEQLYQPICQQFGKLPVSSFFRSPALNRAVGGEADSAHLYGCAVDIDCDGLGKGFPSNKQLFEWVRANLRYDKVITEFPDANGNPGWIHVALNPYGKSNRMWAMKAVGRDKNGKAIYQTL